MRGCRSGVHDRLTRRAGGWTRGAAAVTLAVILVATMVVLLARPYSSSALTTPTVPSVPTPTPTVPAVTVPPVTVPPVTVPKPPPVTVTPPKTPQVTTPAQTPAIQTPTVSTPSVPGATSTAGVPSVGHGSGPNLPAAQGVAGSSGQRASSPASSSSGAAGSSSSPSAGSSTAGSPMTVTSTAAARDRRGGPAASGVARRHKPPLLSNRRLRRLVSRLKGCLQSLAPRESNVLVLRTGLGLKHAYSRRQVARILHVTLQQEGKAERKAVTGLQNASAGGRCVSAQSSVPAAVARTVSLLASTNQLGPTGNASPGAFPGAPQPAGKSSSPGHGGAHANSGGGGSSNPEVKSASISPQQHAGFDWLVLALLAAAAVMALWFIVARRQPRPETAAAVPRPGPRRLRRPSWGSGIQQLRQGAGSFARAVGLVALSDAAAHRRHRRAAAGASSPARRQHQPAAVAAATDANGATQDTTTAAGVLAEPAPARVPPEPSPERIERVLALQQQLAQLGLEPGPVDGQYGPLTMAAVERFQRAEALPVDGVVGPLTADRLRATESGPPATDRIEQVKALQRQLSWLGFEPGTVDGRYGPITTGAVRRFQEANDLAVDGVVGHDTRDALRASLAQRPSSDRIDRVKGLQRQLSRLGYEPGRVDGRYGPLTTAAVARFQESHELPADGVVDPATHRALEHSVTNSESR